MVNLSMEQQRALHMVELVAQDRHELKEVERERLREARERIKAEVYAKFDADMTEAVTAAKELNVPERRIGMAWGSSSPGTGRGLVEKYWKPGPTPTTEQPPKNEIEEEA